MLLGQATHCTCALIDILELNRDLVSSRSMSVRNSMVVVAFSHTFLLLSALCRVARILEKIRSARPSLWFLCGMFDQQTEFINLFKLLFCFPSSFYSFSSPTSRS